MGSNVYKDINACSEKGTDSSMKTVIIYTTAGDLNDNDTGTCNCFNPSDPDKKRLPYWVVREIGSKNSLHIAACRGGGYGYPLPYPENRRTVINGHTLTRYEFKNTVSYYLRIKAVEYGHWFGNIYASAGTADRSTRYNNWADFVATINAIYKTEMGDIPVGNVSFSMPDIDEAINPHDHEAHLVAGRASAEALVILGQDLNTCFRESLFVDYHTKDLPENIGKPDVQNKAAMTGAYCLALLDYNAWPEWGDNYREWCNRSYFRTTTSCDTTAKQTTPPHLFPNPADSELTVQFDCCILSEIHIQITDSHGRNVRNADAILDASNTLQIPLNALFAGTYVLRTQYGRNAPVSQTFTVVH